MTPQARRERLLGQARDWRTAQDIRSFKQAPKAKGKRVDDMQLPFGTKDD